MAIEEARVEAYFQEVMRGESTDEALNYVRQFYKDSKHHTEVIKEFKDFIELKGMAEQLVSFCCGKILVNKKSLVLYNLVDEDQKKRSRLCEIKQLIKNTWISA